MYKFIYTERNNEKASEFETKSLLYLLSMRDDSSEIDTFIIDCFNDVTGADTKCSKLWDIQSKGVKSLTPTKIGKSLITLFENYISEINFSYYILFFPKISNTYFQYENRSVFGIKNFKNKEVKKITSALQTEYTRRHTECQADIIPNKLDEFLKDVNFVIAEENKSDYVRNIIFFKNGFEKNEDFFNTIFNEIRDRQTVLKNISVHNKEISQAIDVLQFNKHIKKNDVEMLIVNRLVGIDIFKNRGIPVSFLYLVKNENTDKIKDIILQCNRKISLTLFSKHNKEAFWDFFEVILSLVKKFPNKSIEDIFNIVPIDKKSKISTLNEISTKYFISLLKEGIEK